MDKIQIIKVLKFIVTHLIDKDYLGVVELDHKKLMTSRDIEDSILEYPGILTAPPNDAYEKIDVYIIKGNAGVTCDFNL